MNHETEQNETTCQIWQAVEEGQVLEAGGIHPQRSEKGFLLESYSSDMDGIFSRLCDWRRFSNKIDQEGASAWVWSMLKGRKKTEMGYYTLYGQKWSNQVLLQFPDPIKIKFGEIAGQPIVKEVSKIEGEVTHEWTFGPGIDPHRANGVEFWVIPETYK